MTTSIGIDRILTTIDTYSNGITKVFCSKMAMFTDIISSRNVVTIHGLAKQAKMEKYINLMIDNGFTMSKLNHSHNAGFEGKNSDVVSYSITFTK